MKSVSVNVGGALVVLELMSDGRTPSSLCWLVQPFTRWTPTGLWFVERVTPRYVFTAECGSGRSRRFDRDWLAVSSMVLIVSELESGRSSGFRFYGAARLDGRLVSYRPGLPLPPGLVGYSELVGPDQHRRVWEICPGSTAEGLWPIDLNKVEARRRGASWHERTLRVSVFDLWLISLGFVDGCEAVYQGDEI